MCHHSIRICDIWKLRDIFTQKWFICTGEYGPAIGLFVAANTGCNPAATVAILAIGVGFNGGIYSGFKVHTNYFSFNFLASRYFNSGLVYINTCFQF